MMASTNVSTLLSPGQYEVAKDLVRLFYVVSPTETSFEHVEDVPDFVNKVRINEPTLNQSFHESVE